jgi:hypothetical protein
MSDRAGGKAKGKEKGHWISVRTKTGRVVHVFVPGGKRKAFDGGSGTRGARRPMPADLEDRMNERGRVFRREEGDGYRFEVSKNPNYRWVPEEKKYVIRTVETDGTVSDSHPVNKRENIDRKIAQLRRAYRG